MTENEQERLCALRSGHAAFYCRSTIRGLTRPDFCGNILGFRIARRYQFVRSIRGGYFLGEPRHIPYAPSAHRRQALPNLSPNRCGFRLAKRK